MNFVELFHRVAHTVNNDVVKPIQRDVVRPVARTVGVPIDAGRIWAARLTGNPEAQIMAQSRINDSPVIDAAQAVRDYVISPIPNLFRAAVTSPSEKRGGELLDSAATQYGFSPEFKNTIAGEHPVHDSTHSVGAAAGGYNTPHGGIFGTYNSIHVAKSNPKYERESITHEGLHSMFPKLSKHEQQDFLKTVQQEVNRPKPKIDLGPAVADKDMKVGVTYYKYDGKYYAKKPPAESTEADLRGYLKGVLSGKNYPDSKKGSIDNISKLPLNIQNEIHSFTNEYYQESGRKMPQALADYYSRYLRTSSSGDRQQLGKSLSRAIR